MIHLVLGRVCIGNRRVSKCRAIPLNMNARLHWATRAKWNHAWKDEVFARFLHAGYRKPRAPLYRPHVTLTFFRIQPGDYDGLWQSAKPLIDGLVSLGLVQDDSPAHLPPPIVEHRAVKHRAEEHVEIDISETPVSEAKP